MPVLRWPHDRHRDLRTRLLSALASHQHDQNRHVMMTIAASQYRNARRFFRPSTGHAPARSDQQLGPPKNTRSPIKLPPFGRDDLRGHRVVADQCAQSIARNSHTAPAALKSP
jgi:hypothetical protein